MMLGKPLAPGVQTYGRERVPVLLKDLTVMVWLKADS
jgi:hypothetical protein